MDTCNTGNGEEQHPRMGTTGAEARQWGGQAQSTWGRHVGAPRSREGLGKVGKTGTQTLEKTSLPGSCPLRPGTN